ncbi:hypothetical protein CRE_26753 [Caenorhabditis remanei]|uniref:MATH domain-containing protein n=1 Tax=Caenorhabditis remanei TaxID=31234 RepID=E3MXV1_CAERE|nr:hypothetical protein CRE_26753 [Caenorhabditis remanei]
MVRPGKFMLYHSFRAVDLSKESPCCGPIETINGITCWISCFKMSESKWTCSLIASNQTLGMKIKYKIITKNGYETVGTTDEKVGDSSTIFFRDNPKYYVNGNMTIECHVEFYEVDGNGIRKPGRNTQFICASSLTMDLTEKFVLSHSFRAVELPNGDWASGPTETINGIDCYIYCHKVVESTWACALLTLSEIPSLGWKVEFKIRTKNGYETIGTGDGSTQKYSDIWFQDDPKYYVDGNMAIECHVKFYEIDGNGIWIPRKVIQKETEIGFHDQKGS